MNIAIIDDIASDAEQLKRIITSYFENRQIPTEIRYFSSAEAFFDDYRPGNFQILFLESYDVNAAYYLLKPFQPEKLCQILDSFRLKEALHARYIEIISDRVPVRVPLHSILYADTFRNAVCLHTDAGPLRSYLTFHKFEEQIRDGFLLDNGETVQIRKRGSAAIRKAYLQYLFSSGEGKSLP